MKIWKSNNKNYNIKKKYRFKKNKYKTFNNILHKFNKNENIKKLDLYLLFIFDLVIIYIFNNLLKINFQNKITF
jgi:hypothetical protein